MITAGSLEKVRALKSKFPWICEQIAAEPEIITRLADMLYSKELINLDTVEAVNVTGLSAYDRARRIMRPAIACSARRNADKLIEILEEFSIDI